MKQLILFGCVAVVNICNAQQPISSVSDPIRLSIGNGNSKTNLSGQSEAINLEIGLNSEKSISGNGWKFRLN